MRTIGEIKRFQTDFSQVADGKVGPKTRATMVNLLNANKTKVSPPLISAPENGIVSPTEPQPVPQDNPISFADPPATGYYTLVTEHKEGRIVSYFTKDGTILGRRGLMFMANRSSKGGSSRYHVGIDPPAHKGDCVVSCESGRIVNFYPFVYAGKSFAS
jgi:hypothetical protein